MSVQFVAGLLIGIVVGVLGAVSCICLMLFPHDVVNDYYEDSIYDNPEPIQKPKAKIITGDAAYFENLE